MAPDDWDTVRAAAETHDLGALVYVRVKQHNVTLPPVVGDVLRASYVAGAARNMRLFDALGKILRSCETAGTPVIPLKGACLAERIYGDIALRPMADLDLLVKPADLPSAIETLRRLRYVADQPFDPAAQRAEFQDMPPMRRPDGVMVELHWTLVTPLCGARIDEDELRGLWERSTPTTIAGVPSRMLSPEDLLLHLCMHASVHHRFANVGLRAFVDIAEVARHFDGELDWPTFAERANRWGVANGVGVALTLAQEWTGVGVPTDVWQHLGAPEPDAQTLDWARQKVLEGGAVELTSEFARLESNGGVAGRLAALRTAAFPPRAVMARLYGVPGDSWRIFVWYPYRLWDLFSRYRGSLWKLLRRDKTFVDDTRREARLREYLGWK